MTVMAIEIITVGDIKTTTITSKSSDVLSTDALDSLLETIVGTHPKTGNYVESNKLVIEELYK